MSRNSRLFIVQMIFIDVVLAAMSVEKALMFGVEGTRSFSNSLAKN